MIWRGSLCHSIPQTPELFACGARARERVLPPARTLGPTWPRVDVRSFVSDPYDVGLWNLIVLLTQETNTRKTPLLHEWGVRSYF